jgi:hypothetical protein
MLINKPWPPGSEELTFSEFGAHHPQVNFEIPAGISVALTPTWNWFLNHSQLIDYLRSGIVVRVNDVAVGSVRLSDTTAGVSSELHEFAAHRAATGVNQLISGLTWFPRVCVRRSAPRQPVGTFSPPPTCICPRPACPSAANRWITWRLSAAAGQ